MALTITFGGFDWLMGLDYHWFSTMWGVYLFAGAAGSSMALIVLVVYALKKPNPWPGTFGFHEIFHTCTVLAFMCHWAATLIIALAPAYHAG